MNSKTSQHYPISDQSSASRWTIYLKERFPLVPNILVALGIVMSAKILMMHTQIVGDDSVVPGVATLIAFLGGMIFLAQIRLMDELKDIAKDRIAHPNRPLPRGLFTENEFAGFILRFNFLMLFIAIVAGFLLSMTAGLWFLLGTVYLYLMFKEFFMGSFLSRSPLFYAISHQVIIIPMAVFVLSCFVQPGSDFGVPFSLCLNFSLLLLGGFFAFEVGRKLDPNAHPILNTYLSIYGIPKTVFILATCLAISSVASIQLGMGFGIFVLSSVVLSLCTLLWLAPAKFKWIEGMMTLLLLALLWWVPASNWINQITGGVQ